MIIAHCLVQNEGRFIWYALNSILPFVDEIMVWDMGSTDGTWEIINSISAGKLKKKRLPAATNPNDLTRVRQQMIAETTTDWTWLMILDGDEIWPKTSIEKATALAREHPEFESIVVKTNNLVGDIYHRLPQSSGHYELAGRVGHLALRFMNLKLIKGLSVNRPHGTQGFFDSENKLVQDRDPKKIVFVDCTYHHATHLQRSVTRKEDLLVPKRSFKLKYEIGESIPKKQIPEIFFAPGRPAGVPDVTHSASLPFWLIAAIQTIPRRIKRLLFKGKAGY